MSCASLTCVPQYAQSHTKAMYPPPPSSLILRWLYASASYRAQPSPVMSHRRQFGLYGQRHGTTGRQCRLRALATFIVIVNHYNNNSNNDTIIDVAHRHPTKNPRTGSIVKIGCSYVPVAIGNPGGLQENNRYSAPLMYYICK